MGCLLVTAKLLQNEHFLYGTCLHNCKVWQQRAETFQCHCEYGPYTRSKICIKRNTMYSKMKKCTSS